MEKQVRVALYGCSLLISGLAASLKAVPELAVVQIQPGDPDAGQRLQASRAEVIVFDIDAAPQDLVLEQFRAHPEQHLLVLDQGSDHLMALSCQVIPCLTIEGFLQLIRRYEPDRFVSRGENHAERSTQARVDRPKAVENNPMITQNKEY
jgi:hypothetical protein